MVGVLRVCGLLLLCGGLLVGCRPATPATAATGPAAPAVAVALRSPEDVTRGLVELLRAHLQAIARHDRGTANRLRDQAAQEIVARGEVMARYNALSSRTARDETEALHRLVESWAAGSAYYADGFALERMRLSAVAGEGGKAVVDVPAQGRGSEAVLQVACIRGPDEQWRVVGIEFAPPEAHGPTTASTRAASQPAREPSHSSK